jgi:hypothetical protein
VLNRLTLLKNLSDEAFDTSSLHLFSVFTTV